MSRVLPLFYFHLCTGTEFVEDELGQECRDYADAHAKAVRSLRDVMAGDLLMGDLNTASFIEIEDEERNLLATVHFADVVNLRSEPHLRRARSSALNNGGKAPD